MSGSVRKCQELSRCVKKANEVMKVSFWKGKRFGKTSKGRMARRADIFSLVVKMCQEVSGCVRMCQNVSGRVRNCQDVSGIVRKCQEGQGIHEGLILYL